MVAVDYAMLKGKLIALFNRTKKVAVPSRCVNQLSKSLHSIKDKSGAHLEFEKVDKKSGDRTLIIR